MKRGLFLIALCSLVALAIAGCGGTNSGNGITNSPFVGSYVGTFSYNGGGVGEFAMYISSNGNVTGRGVNVTFPAEQSLSGTIQNSGLIAITISGTANAVSYAGTLALTPQTSLTGTLRGTGGNTMTIAVAEPTIAGSPSPFAGSYHGSFTNGSNQNNNLWLIVDANGNITGADDNTSASTFFTLSGSVTQGGTVSLTSSLGGNPATGTLSLTSNTLSGALNGQAGLPTSISLTADTKIAP